MTEKIVKLFKLFLVCSCIVIGIFFVVFLAQTLAKQCPTYPKVQHVCNYKCDHVMVEYVRKDMVEIALHLLRELGLSIIDVKFYVNRSGHEEAAILYRKFGRI